MSTEKHPSDDSLRRFATGTSSRDEGRRIASHLLRGCGACAARLRQIQQPGIRDGAYDVLFARMESSPPRGAGASALPAPVDTAARALLADLDTHPEARQEILVRNSRRYLSPGLARLLCERSFELRYQDPRRPLRSARLAVAIADRLQTATAEETAQLADLRALCSSQLCNALRVTGDLQKAERAIAAARLALRAGTGDPLPRALVYERLGALRKWQCRYEESIRAYEQATEIFRDLGRRNELARVLVGHAVALDSTGDPEGALALLLEAIPKIEGENDPRLTLAACHAVVSCQIDAGHIEDASLKWIELRFLYEQIGDPLLRLREKWLEGKLLIAQGVIPAGIRLLENARLSYQKRGMLYDAAVIALEIAQGHLRRGRSDHVRSLLSETLPVLRDLDVDKEVLTAFVHLRSVSGKREWGTEPS